MKIPVTLTCSDGKKLVKYYDIINSCDCKPCTDGKPLEKKSESKSKFGRKAARKAARKAETLAPMDLLR